MRRSGKLLIILGVVLAAVAFGGIYVMMNRTTEPVEAPEVFTVPVVVAAMDIPARTVLMAENVTVKEMPIDMVPPLAVTEVMSATGSIAMTDIYADQILLHSMLADEETGSNLIPALNVPEGMVAMAVPINEISGVGEALRIGDHVDIIGSLYLIEHDAINWSNAEYPEYSAQFTIQNVEILHLGSWAPPMPDETASDGSASSGLMGGGGATASGTTCEPLNIAILLLDRQDALVMKFLLDMNDYEARQAFTFILRGVQDEYGSYTTEAVNQEYMTQRFKFARPPFLLPPDDCDSICAKSGN